MTTKQTAKINIKRLEKKLARLVRDLDYHATKYEDLCYKIDVIQHRLHVLQRLTENGIWTEIDKHIAEDFKTNKIIN